MKTCSKCGAIKTESEFSVHSFGTLRKTCKLCRAQKARDNHLLDPEIRRAKDREYRRLNRDRTNTKDRERREKDPEKARLAARKTYAKNKEKYRKAANVRYHANPEKFRAQARALKQKNPDRHYRIARGNRLKKEYNISLEDYDALVAKQSGCCAICGKASKETLPVDHDHETGRIRGLLCRSCNVGLGQFQESPELLLKAVDYLQKGAK